jgi:ABC-type proline/glycine betaine transport system permease subunit
MIFFVPVIVSSGVVLQLQAQDWMRDLMQSSLEFEEAGNTLQSVALREYLLESGLSRDFVLYITGAVNRIHEIINRSGVQILLALAALQSIPDSFYEAAHMEGATKWEVFWKITFPVIAPVLLASAVYTIIDSFTAFDNETMRMVRTTAFGQSQYGQSAAMAWVYFVVVLAIIGVVFGLTSRKVFYRD